MDVSRWLVFYAENGRIEDEVPFGRIRPSVLNRGLDGTGIAICPKGLRRVLCSRPYSRRAGPGENVSVPLLPESAQAVTCPLCWLKFDVGDAMSIAVHESLRGDPVLGPDEMLRFLPTSFNEDGVPLDPAGMPGARHRVSALPQASAARATLNSTARYSPSWAPRARGSPII